MSALNSHTGPRKFGAVMSPPLSCMTRAGSETSSRTFSNMLSQVQTLRDGVIGVNLDEEAANLIKFQQAYQASAQVISAAENLFSTLLQAVSR